ncbi:MAG TPA: adenosine deaminase [Myxococcales bacterium]|nr:adenosine deaminase [Myxococcales bacterium]HBU47358.1 adenosine deaminase [Myxococcales bacterium]|tara:strand:+ start:337 stop:1419 length:1083 start_codon:yes stop_codon:yes gene_type:complete
MRTILPTNDPDVTRELIQAMPKTDLHCHLDGSMRLSTIIDLAKEQKVELPSMTEEGLAKAIHMGEICEDLVDYLVAFKYTCAVLQVDWALERAAYELIVDAHADGVRYIEVRFCPELHLGKGLDRNAIVESVLSGLRRGRRELGVSSGLIICGLRNIDAPTSLRLARLAVSFKDRGVVGFDLAGAELHHPAKDHREAFYLIRNNNMNCTLHAGEADGPDSIHEALHYCGSHRIGHGVRLVEDGSLLNYVNDRRIPIEICLKSNLQTRAVARLEDHPLRHYYDTGLRLAISTDNRLITDTTVTDEYLLAVDTFDFTFTELKRLVIQGFKSAFLPYRHRKDLLVEVAAKLDAMGGVPVSQVG